MVELKVIQPQTGRCCTSATPSIGATEAKSLSETFKVLADPTRIQILSLLAQYSGQVCVCDIVDNFDLSQPTISHHLRLLKDAGLIDAEKHGLWVYYQLKPQALDAVRSFLKGLS